jgi:hypothetical protein
MKQCTGCGKYNTEPLGLNKNGEPYLACCPDNNYVEVNDMKIYSELQIVQSLKHHNISDSEIFKIISFLEPMEIPMDNEIELESKRYGVHGVLFSDGAKWMKHQITGLKTNNIQLPKQITMKLYTEEQLQESYNRGLMDGRLNNIDYSITNGFKPIELPTDEEIEDLDENEYNLSIEEMCRFKEGIEYLLKFINEQK